METLLPSEVARLVLGYLQDNCEDAARIFLEQSSHLAECLELAKQGRKYTTKVMGNSLMDLLQEYCAVHCLVSERSQKLPENAAEQLKQSASLVQKLKFLIDASKSGQTFLLSITVPSQGAGSQTGSTPASSGRSKSWLQCSSERAKRSGVRSQKSKDKEDRSGRRSSNNSVEATPLHSLPGLSPAGNWNSSRERVDSNDDQADAPGCSPASCSTPRRKGPPPRKKLNTSLSKLKKTHSEENDSNESVDITVLQQALLENKQLHEKIAENINRVMRIPSDGPSESQPPVAPLPESLPVPCDGMMNELDQAIKTIVHQTEQDPLFESFLEEILGPIEEEVSSSPAAGDCESDTEETGSGSPRPREAAVEEDCLNTPRASHLVDEESTPAPGEVPLKQRLRSARNRMSDGSAPTPSTPSTHGNLSQRLAAESPENEAPSPATKEQRKKESLLEEQNAAAIQSIITANIEKTVSDGSKTTLEKEADINMDKQQLSGTHLTENRDRKCVEAQLTVNSHPENGEAENSLRESHLNTGQNYVTEISVPDNSGASETVENCSSQQQVNYVGSKGGDSHLTVPGGSSNENQGLSGTVMTAVTGHSNEDSTAADSGTTFSTATSVTVPVSIQPSCIWEGLPVILATPPDSQRQKGGVPIVQPVHVPVAVERGRMVLAVERPATASVAPAPLAVSLADQHPAVATSSIILYNSDRHFQPFTSTSLYQTPNFATIDATQPLSIAPKGTKMAVRETQGTGENIVLSSITKMDAVNKQDIGGVVDPALTDNKKNVHKKTSSSKKKTKKKLGSKKNVSTHEKKKPAVGTQNSKKKSSDLKKGNETLQKSENNLASESSIIVMDAAPGISLSIPDISYNDSHQFSVTKEVSLTESRIQVTSSFESSVKSVESSSGVYRHKSQDVVKDKDMPLVNNDAPNSTHLSHTNSLLKPASEIGAYNVLCSNEKSVNPDANSGAKQKPESDDSVHKPRQTPQVRQDINKNTAEKSGSGCKPRQTPLVRRTSSVAGGRLSLSTPRRRTSHIRALDFGTPPKSVTNSLIKRRSNSAPKDTAHDANTSCSPDSSSDSRIQQAKSVRSSLFKSPDLMTSRQHSNMLTPTLTVPIATRTPTPKLSGDWEKITGAGLIFGNSSPLLASPTREQNNEPICSGQSISTPVEEDRNSTEGPSSPVEVVLESSDNQKNDSDRCATPVGKQEGALAVWRKSILNYTKCKKVKTRAWDADLRAIVAQDYQENVKKPTAKKRTVKRVRKKVDKETEEEGRLVESRLESMMEEIGHKETEGDELTPEQDISGTVISVEESTEGNKSLDTPNESTENVPVNTACLETKQTSDKTLVLLADTNTSSANVEEEFVTSSEKTANAEADESSPTSEQVGNSKFVRPKQTSSKQISKNRKRKASGVPDEAPKKRQKVKACSTIKEKKLKVKNTKGGNDDNTTSLANNSVIPAARGLGASSSLEVKVDNAEMDGSELGHTNTKANPEVTATVTDATSTANSTENKETPNVASHNVCKEINVSEAFISTAALETPQKVSPTSSIVGTGFQIPITPRIMSPSTLLDTPISNFLREQPSIDLSMIPTPNFPPTPNIAVTPHSAELNSPTSYASRPTDYSSCSSYYKPSHSPSRSLEQVLIDECNRIESSVSPDRVDFKRSTAVCHKEMAESQEVCISISEEDSSVIHAEQQVTAVIYNNDSRRDVSTAGGTQATSKIDASGESGVHSTDIEKSDKKETSVKTHSPEVLEENSGSAVCQQHSAQFTVENSVIVSKQSMTATSKTTLSEPSPSTNKECQSETDNIVVREGEERLNETEKLQPDSEISCTTENLYNETVMTAKILNVPESRHGASGQSATLKGNNNKRKTTSSIPEPDRRTKRRISHSAIDLSVSSVLEMKKNRMMAKLKGGTCDTVKGSKVKEVMKKDKHRKKDNKPVAEKENNEKVLCKATASGETVASEESSASKETPASKETSDIKENQASKETVISKEPAASKETVIIKEPAAIKETVISKEPAATKKTPVSKETAATTKQTPVNNETAATKETPLSKETAATKETPVNKETAATKETIVNKETAATKETPVSKETATSKEIAVSKETATTKEIAVSKETAATKETPVSKETATSKETAVIKETVASKEHFSNKETASGQEITVSKETSSSKETSGLEMSGLENIGCEEPVAMEKVSVVNENVSTVIRSSQESPAFKSVSGAERGTESLTRTVTPQKGILLRRQGISVNIIAERLMEAQNPVVNRMSCSKDSSKSFNESHLTAHLGSSQNNDMVERTESQQALVSNTPSARNNAQCSQNIDTSQATIGSQNEKRKSQVGHNVPSRYSVINDENEMINSSEKKDCEVPHKNKGLSSRRSSKKNRNSTEISTEPESCKLIDVEAAGREMTTTSSTANEIPSLQERGDNSNVTNKKPEDVAHKISGKEVSAKDDVIQRKNNENNRKSLKSAEYKRENTSIKNPTKLVKVNIEDHLNKSVVDSKRIKLSNISVAEKCSIQDISENSSVNQYGYVGRNEKSNQGSQPLDMKEDHVKEEGSTKAKKSTKSRNETGKDCLPKNGFSNTCNEDDKVVGNPVIVEKSKVQHTLKNISDIHHHRGSERSEKRRENIQKLKMKGEHDCPETITVKTSTESRKENIEKSITKPIVENICNESDNIRAVTQNAIEDTPDTQHLTHVNISESDGKNSDDNQPSFVCNTSADSSNMYVIIQYEGNGPCLQKKESEDLSDTTFTVMDEVGARTLSVSRFFDLLTISPQEVSPRATKRSTNEPDVTPKAATMTLVCDENSSVAHTKAGGSVAFSGSLPLKHSPKKPHHSGHSRAKTSHDRRREVKHTNSSYKHRTGDKSLKALESRSSHKTKRQFHSPDKIMSKYRHGVRGSPRSTMFQRDRSVTPSRAPPRRPSTDGTKPRRLPLKSPQPMCKVSSTSTVDSISKRGTPISRLKDVHHKSSHKRESLYPNLLRRCFPSGTQVEGENVKHKKEKCASGHMSNSSDSRALRYTRDSLPGSLFPLLQKARDDASVTDSGDDLMTYALLGSVREEDSNSSTQQQYSEAASRENWSDSHSSIAVATSSNEDVKILPPKKRKPSTEDGLAQVEKKIHTEFSQKLLKGIDVDNFLNYVHDGEKRHKD